MTEGALHRGTAAVACVLAGCAREVCSVEEKHFDLEAALDPIDWSKAVAESSDGTAHDLPALLTAALRRQNLWNEIAARLYHQDSIYEASVAALPALAVVARDAEDREDRIQAVVLAGMIDLWLGGAEEKKLSARIPIATRRQLPRARATLFTAARALRGAKTPRSTKAYLEIAHLVFEGRRDEARARIDGDEE